jgi:hypothetical protein
MWSVAAFLVLVGASYDITQAFARISFFEETMNLPFAFGLMDDVRGQNSGWQECPAILVDERQHHNAPLVYHPSWSYQTKLLGFDRCFFATLNGATNASPSSIDTSFSPITQQPVFPQCPRHRNRAFSRMRLARQHNIESIRGVEVSDQTARDTGRHTFLGIRSDTDVDGMSWHSE